MPSHAVGLFGCSSARSRAGIGLIRRPACAIRISIHILSDNLSRLVARVLHPDLALVVQDYVQQRIIDFQFPVVFDIAQFAEFVHEPANPSASKSPAARSSEPKNRLCNET